jgi:hypothetical protein
LTEFLGFQWEFIKKTEMVQNNPEIVDKQCQGYGRDKAKPFLIFFPAEND